MGMGGGGGDSERRPTYVPMYTQSHTHTMRTIFSGMAMNLFPFLIELGGIQPATQ
jgi:hypothetical protein